jgi:hypothetical protein
MPELVFNSLPSLPPKSHPVGRLKLAEEITKTHATKMKSHECKLKYLTGGVLGTFLTAV